MPINPYGGSYTTYTPGGASFSPYNGAITAYQQPNTVYMVLVNSEEDAKNYALNPGNSMFFMDSNNQFFYTKSVDFSGIATFKKYQFHEVMEKLEAVVADNYVTREEFEELKKSMNRKPYYKKERSENESSG